MVKLSEIDLSWNIRHSVSRAGTYEGDIFHKITDAELKKKVTGLSKGDKIIICYGKDGSILHTQTVMSNTMGGLLNAVHRGTHIKLTPKTKFNKSGDVLEYVYRQTSRWIRSDDRIRMTTKFEKRGITPAELYGDHVFFEGFRKKGKYIGIAYGS